MCFKGYWFLQCSVFLHHSAVVWKGAASLILPLPRVWVQDLYLQGFLEGFQDGRLKRVLQSLLWGWEKANYDHKVQGTFPHAGSSLQKRALELCWSCFSPSPSLRARCIPMPGGASDRMLWQQTPFLLLPLSLVQQTSLLQSLPIPSPSPFWAHSRWYICLNNVTHVWHKDVPVACSRAAGQCLSRAEFSIAEVFCRYFALWKSQWELAKCFTLD